MVLSWQEAHLKDISDNYGKSKFYPKYEREILQIYEQEYDMLIDINMRLIEFMIKAFNIDTQIVYSSEFGFNSKSTNRLVDLVTAVGGDIYLSGPMGKDYLDVGLFEKKGIQIIFQDFKHPIYQQQYDGFEPNMSAIDAMFNTGRIPE